MKNQRHGDHIRRPEIRVAAPCDQAYSITGLESAMCCGRRSSLFAQAAILQITTQRHVEGDAVDAIPPTFGKVI
jgi:hypothetical protein